MKKLLFLTTLFVVSARAQGNVPPSLQQGNAQVFSGQQAVTATATALPSQSLKTICIKAMHANTTNVYIGNSTVTTSGSTGGMELVADQSYCAAVTNANQIYIIGTAGANVAWLGTN